MTPAKIEVRVKQAVAEFAMMPIEQLTLTTRFDEDLGADSILVEEMILELEQAFSIEIATDTSPPIKTVGDMVTVVMELVMRDHVPCPSCKGTGFTL